MGSRKNRKWKEEEEEALCGGVAKHGLGKWTNILKDPKFGPTLLNRSSTDLKDKWRNLVTRDSYKEKPKMPKVTKKTITSQPAAAPGSSAAATQASGDSSIATVEEQPLNGLQDGEKPPQNKLGQHSAAGHKNNKKKRMMKKNVPKRSPRKGLTTRFLPSGVRTAVLGTVRRSQRIMMSRFRTLPSNPDDPIVIDD